MAISPLILYLKFTWYCAYIVKLQLLMSKKQASKLDKRLLLSEQPSNCHHSQQQSQAALQAKEKEIVDNLNRENIHNYLKGIEVTSYMDQMAKGITRYSAQKITHSLKNGLIQIARNPPPLPNKTANSQRLSSEEKRDLENKARRENITRKIDYLYEQIRGESSQENEKMGNLQVDYKEILTKEEHERKVRQIVQDKLERKKRMQQMQQQAERKRKDEEQKQQIMKKLEQQKQKEIKRQKIQQKIKKRKEEHDKTVELNAQLQKQLLNAKNRSRLYQEMEERYQSQILLPSLEQKKTKLKEIRDFHKRYDVETIKQHQKQYLQKSQQKMQERRLSSPQWKYQAPSRTQRLSKLLKDQEIQIKQQLQARKKKLQEMQKRQQLYRLQLKEKHQPIVDEDKRKEIAERLIRQKRKYDKMHPDIDHKKLGEAYLEIAKRMRRPESVKQPQSEDQPEKLLKSQQQSQNNLPRANHTHEFYQRLRRKKIQNIISSDQKSVSEKYLMLKMESQKLGEKLKQKEELVRYQHDEQAQNDAAQLLLSSIKAKMGIMDILNNKRTSSEESI